MREIQVHNDFIQDKLHMQVHNDFIQDKLHMVVATTAFGMVC